MNNVLIIGATSAIAEAIARIFAQRGDQLYLVARNMHRLNAIAKDLSIRNGTTFDFAQLNVNEVEVHEQLINKAFNALGKIDIVLIAHGTLPEQKVCESDVGITLEELNTNATGTISLLTHIANKLEKQKSGSIAVITSVAGDRGRQSNYVYGTAKGMVSIFLQGLRNRLHSSNVHVIDIRPGFVDTPMTADFKKGMLWVKPDVIAAKIVAAIDKKKHTVYVPFFWQLIMLAIKLVPEFVFVRMRL